MADEASSSGSALSAWAQVLTIVLLTVLGMLIGALMPWIGLAPIVGILLPLAAATGFLRREGLGWRDLGFGRPMPVGRCLLGALAGLLVIYLVTGLLVTPLLRAAGAPPLDVSLLTRIIEGDLVNYLWFLLPVSWGSAAVGEELLARGFLLNRFERVHGTTVAIVLQAVLFSAGHFYQGITGMANILVVALVLGVVYVRLGRNLWPVILAHGAIDTVGITALYLGYADQLTGS